MFSCPVDVAWPEEYQNLGIVMADESKVIPIREEHLPTPPASANTARPTVFASEGHTQRRFLPP